MQDKTLDLARNLLKEVHNINAPDDTLKLLQHFLAPEWDQPTPEEVSMILQETQCPFHYIGVLKMFVATRNREIRLRHDKRRKELVSLLQDVFDHTVEPSDTVIGEIFALFGV